MTQYSICKLRPSLIAAALLLTTTAPNAAGSHTEGETTRSAPIAEYRELNPDETIIQTLLDIYGSAMESKSVELMEQAVIPDDFSTIESGYPNWTWEDFRDNHLLVEMKMFTDVSYQIQLIAGELQGSLGFAVYQYEAAGKVQDRAVSVRGLGTAILEQTDAGWRLHHLHTSAPRSELEGMGG